MAKLNLNIPIELKHPSEIPELQAAIELAKSAYLGIATTTTTPPATGAYWYRVDAPGTYMGITVTEADFKDVEGNYYDVTLEVKDGVAEKKVREIPTPTFDAENITPGQTTFAQEVIFYGKNRFNKNAVTNDFYVNAITGALDANTNYVASDWIFVGDLQGDNITFSPQLFHVAFYSEKNEASYISGREFGGDTIQIPQGANWLRCSIRKDTIDSYQIEVGETTTAYENYQAPTKEIVIPFLKIEEIEIVDASITPEKTTFAKKVSTFGKNRFDKSKVTSGKFVNAFTGKLDASANYVSSDYIFIGDLTQVTGTKIWHIAFYSDATETSYISGSEGVDTVAVPSGAKYARVSVNLYDEGYGVDTYQLEGGTTKTAYEPYSTGGFGIFIENLILPETTPVTSELPKILLPSIYWLANGIEYNFYFQSFFVPKLAENFDNYYKSVFSHRGKFLQKKFRVTPTDDFSMIYKIEDSEGRFALKPINVLTAPTANGTGVNRKVLVIGDSTINNGGISKRVSDYFANDVMDVTLLGTRQSQGVNHEGRSGWTFQNYIESGSISGVANPFFNNGTFDFAHYLTTTSQTMGANDWVFIQLGINDLYPIALQDGSQTPTAIETRLNEVKARLEVFINSIKAYNSNIRIGIIQTFPPAISQDATGNLLQSAYYSLEYYYKKGIAKWWEFLLEEYDNEESRTAKIYLIGANAVIDRENDFATAMQNIDQYDTTQIEVQMDDIHPYEGYNQVGDIYIGAIKYFG